MKISLSSAVIAAIITGALAYLAATIRYWRKVKEQRQRAVDQSRAVLKGKMAEHMAPLLPGFAFVPADARFLGDPIDYVVFDGYGEARDGDSDQDVSIVLLDVKSGSARLSPSQHKIAEAVARGDVYFEVARVTDDGRVTRKRVKTNRHRS